MNTCSDKCAYNLDEYCIWQGKGWEDGYIGAILITDEMKERLGL